MEDLYARFGAALITLASVIVGLVVGAGVAMFLSRCTYGYRKTFTFSDEEEEIVHPKDVCLLFRSRNKAGLLGRVKFVNDLDKEVTLRFKAQGPFPLDADNPNNPNRGVYTVPAGSVVESLDIDKDPGWRFPGFPKKWKFDAYVPDGNGGQRKIDPGVRVKRG